MTKQIARARPALALEVVRNGPGWRSIERWTPDMLAHEVAVAVVGAVKLPAPSMAATLLLASDAQVRILNRDWRGMDKPTNVLSFPRGPGPLAGKEAHLGDIAIARETLRREAQELGIPPGDHFRHLVLHGLLHLLGFDHETDAEADEMEALERRILATIGVPDPYAGSEPVLAREIRAAKVSRNRRTK